MRTWNSEPYSIITTGLLWMIVMMYFWVSHGLRMTFSRSTVLSALSWFVKILLPSEKQRSQRTKKFLFLLRHNSKCRSREDFEIYDFANVTVPERHDNAQQIFNTSSALEIKRIIEQSH